MIKLELTNEEAESFKKFREHQDFFTVLIDNDVHLLRNGNAQLNFNNDRLANIILNQTVYKF